ncbi:MAG: hypothetical protein ACAI34_13195 [Verrucomicrobium sp.]
MSLINSLENRFGRFAIPGLVAILAGFEAVVWILITLQPGFRGILELEPELVRQGQIWRLITWVFIPSTSSPIWMIFAVFIMFLISSVLDSAWGPFRVNLYILGGVVSVIVGAMFFDSPPTGLVLYTSIFLAFACIVPDYEFMIFFVLPVKVKYLAMISGAILLLTFANTPGMRGSIIFSILNFLVAFGPGYFKGMKHRTVVAERRARFDAAKTSDEPYFHKCHQCGKTDVDDRHLDFRVTDDGEEYCTVCRPRK